jgi:hypothetical protein
MGAMGYVYLFQQDGSLSPGAGQSYVTYGFNLLSGNYMATYNMNANGGNPEDSTITTPNYTYHFGDRWQEDQMKISIGGATNVDILDRHKALFYPGVCARSEDTFDGIVVSSHRGRVRREQERARPRHTLLRRCEQRPPH